MNYEWEEEEKAEKALTNKKKQKQQLTLLFLLLGAGAWYYFFVHLSEKRKQAITEIKTMLENNPTVNLNDLNPNLWSGKENWEEHLTDLYLSSQIQQFTKQMKEAIKTKAEELTKENLTPKQIKDIAIKEIEDGCSEEEKEWQAIKDILKNYAKKIKNSSIDNISTLQKEANELIVEERVKKQGLHWERKIKESEKSWVDRELVKFVETFKDAWIKKQRDGGTKASFNAPYKIKFPPSLWNELTEEQKQHEKAEELQLDPRVDGYEFNNKITDWYITKFKINFRFLVN